ncbi:hypothetical protein NP233_g391 [Leucocoprinus birnbaumii]|uniref:N-acetyltransferase domain-containing protein n=1 Tax=Leucocoprinus birnbaumii TaxID=56174 RepID=A0AAD5Z0C1_9AGAR|nr:hypothetical protein NP233_g391 [Leucocoprinus birnbaumii]
MSSSNSIQVFDSSLRIPRYVLNALQGNECRSNCALPLILKSQDLESRGQTPPHRQIWVVCSSVNSSGAPSVELMLCVTEGYIDSYPVFIYNHLPPDLLTRGYIQPRMAALANALAEALNGNLARVYAVYGQDPLAEAFAWNWTNITGIGNLVDKPYYAAKLSYCTRQTLRSRFLPLPDDLIPEIRLANDEDVREVAQCCHGFASDSAPYILTRDGALREARYLVHNQQVWVHRITRRGTTESSIASIVACSRNSQNNATITKVYTSPDWRRLGCAERLVRRVCEDLLQTKTTVSLFVAHDNPGATAVYSRVGFVGLGQGEEPLETWTEIGFHPQSVRLGHW